MTSRALRYGLAACLLACGCGRNRERERARADLARPAAVDATPAPAADEPAPRLPPEPATARVSGPPMPVPRSWNEIVCETAVGAIQRELTESGHPAGPADGVWDPRTESAIRTFQNEQSIPKTGLPDRLTLGGLFTDEKSVEIQRVRGEETPARAGPRVTDIAGPFGAGLAAGLLVAIALFSGWAKSGSRNPPGGPRRVGG